MRAVSKEELSDRKPDPWPLWMAGHARLKFVMTECSKTQIRLTRPSCNNNYKKRMVIVTVQSNLSATSEVPVASIVVQK